MRRVSANYARPGMVLGRDVYDSLGNMVIETGTMLSEEYLVALKIHHVGEVLVQDERLIDIPVFTLFPPELEGQAAQAMLQLMTESRGSEGVEDDFVRRSTEPIYGMVRALFPEPLGEINPGGCAPAEEFSYVQPVKVAGLALLMGKRLGWGITELIGLGVAALLKDVGYILLPEGTVAGAEHPEHGDSGQGREHPGHGAGMLGGFEGFGPEVMQAVLQHHERWDGSGYPEGLKGDEVSTLARIVSIADAYYELVSARPWRPALMPHEAVEYVMAYSGEMFDPELVQLLVRQVPLYPTGIMVELNTGEVGVVSDANLGHIGRPVVRICFGRDKLEETRPYDVDLSESRHQDQLIVHALEY